MYQEQTVKKLDYNQELPTICKVNIYQNFVHPSFNTQTSYYILIHHQIFKITMRQAECLTYLSMGKTVKQIANSIGCSHRTVNDHINAMKYKLGLYSTTRLIDCFWNNPIRWF